MNHFWLFATKLYETLDICLPNDWAENVEKEKRGEDDWFLRILIDFSSCCCSIGSRSIQIRTQLPDNAQIDKRFSIVGVEVCFFFLFFIDYQLMLRTAHSSLYTVVFFLLEFYPINRLPSIQNRIIRRPII